MTEDPEARARLSRDPLWTRDQTARFLLQMTLLRVNALRTAREVKTPALVIQSGGDSVVQHDASARLFARLGATDKEWASPPGGLHDFELGPEMEEVAQLITMWVQTHGEKRDALSAQFR